MSQRWLAPEVLEHNTSTLKSDMYVFNLLPKRHQPTDSSFLDGLMVLSCGRSWTCASIAHIQRWEARTCFVISKVAKDSAVHQGVKRQCRCSGWFSYCCKLWIYPLRYSLMKWCWTYEQDSRPDFVRISEALKELLYSGVHVSIQWCSNLLLPGVYTIY
jgi:hypothetical protein